MLNELIARKKNNWLRSGNCPVSNLLSYIRTQGYLRQPQVEALETYLYLKIEGENKPLWQLFAENFFTDDIDLKQLRVSQDTRNYLRRHPAALALYGFALGQQPDAAPVLPELEQLIQDDPAAPDYPRIIKDMFYGVNYADYLMSLPMGAGKTFLMAALMYLDLYFAENEPDNPVFAHNFLVLIPSGLKSSIAPSLKTIENFNPEWVIPQPAAAQIKRQLSFEILDEQKSTRSSNRVRNPNAHKVNSCFPRPYGTVFVVNAEKVILDRLDVNGQRNRELIAKNADERDRAANELRNLLGKIPNLSLLIDEVHHAATDDIKLRQVVNNWQQGGNITTVLGFSGTPFLSSPDRVAVTDSVNIKFSRIANTVYYYPLLSAINSFLKKPQVNIAQDMHNRLDIIRAGVTDFQQQFGAQRYADGTIAKLAIYCGDIASLENEVYPFLVGELRIPEQEILKFHRGNKQHPQPPGSELEFRSLDLAAPHASARRYILLVQVGKEGWDCRSLTGIILSQQGDCRRNMVLQTSCRCLRQVDAQAAQKEEAVIWLNEGNAKILNQQLRQQQQTSIQELNQAAGADITPPAERQARVEQLQLPALDFFQLKVSYRTVVHDHAPHTAQKLQALHDSLEDYHHVAAVTTTDFADLEGGRLRISDARAEQPVGFNEWLHHLAKTGFHKTGSAEFREHRGRLRDIFYAMTLTEQGIQYWNQQYDRAAIESRVRLAFSPKRELETHEEVIPEHAQLLLVDKLIPVTVNDKLYPDEDDTQKILRFDKNPPTARTEQDTVEIQRAIENLKRLNLDTSQLEQQLDEKHSVTVEQRDKSFHYLPYNFIHSGFELELLQKVLSWDRFQDSRLEIYYNGERGLTGFVVQCFQQKGNVWQNIGRYTTDFLIIQRDKTRKTIRKALMIETKGRGYADDRAFQARKTFVETRFLEQNNRQFGYDRFDFLYLEEVKGRGRMNRTINRLRERITEFFTTENPYAG